MSNFAIVEFLDLDLSDVRRPCKSKNIIKKKMFQKEQVQDFGWKFLNFEVINENSKEEKLKENPFQVCFSSLESAFCDKVLRYICSIWKTSLNLMVSSYAILSPVTHPW